MDTEENRPNGQSRLAGSQRAAQALPLAAAFWEQRLADGWTPPVVDGEGFPWAMVRLSLAALLPGMRDAGGWVARAMASPSLSHPPSPSLIPIREGEGGWEKHTALILAGNTPLLAWSPLAAALLAGHRVTAKMSRDETLWPHLFRDALAEVAPDVAERITLEAWPGDDPRTAALVRSTDAVVAFGSDSTIDALRALTPANTPFFGFGHAISVGIVTWDASPGQIERFAQDVLMYDQSGCLSPQVLLYEGRIADVLIGKDLAESLSEEVDHLQVPPVTDFAVARTVRQVRDLALFDGCDTRPWPESDELRWTVIWDYAPTSPLPEITGHSIIHLLPFENFAESWARLFASLRGKISSVGVAGTLPLGDDAFLRAEGVSRICAPGEMQTPPLDWPNGNIDLLAELLQL